MSANLCVYIMLHELIKIISREATSKKCSPCTHQGDESICKANCCLPWFMCVCVSSQVVCACELERQEGLSGRYKKRGCEMQLQHEVEFKFDGSLGTA
jgi:hypothetical protein